MRFASITDRLDPGAGPWHVHELACRRQAKGDDVIVLSIGDPDFAPPPHVVAAVGRSIESGRTHYTASRGDGPLLEAIAARASFHAGRPIGADHVAFFPGAQAALFAVCLCLLERGDEVIVPEPAYATYAGVMAATGAQMVHVPLRPERAFHLDLGDVADLITPRTRVIVVNTPHNPTGAALRPSDLDALVALCAAHDLWLVSDEVYAELVFGREHASALAASGAAERVAIVSSLSKSHAMTGFRHGWVVGPTELADRLEALLDSMLFGSPPFVMDAGLAALTGPQDQTAMMRNAYERRARLVVEALERVPGLRARMPEGGMFVLLDVRGLGVPASAWAVDLLAHEGVALLPTDSFGASGAGHVRIGLAASDDALREACTRIARFARRSRTADGAASGHRTTSA